MSSTETRDSLLFRLFLVGTGKRVTSERERTKASAKATGDHIHASCLSPQRSLGSVIALVFIAGRFVLRVTGWEALGVEIAEAVIWSCRELSVVLAELPSIGKKFVSL